MRFLCILIILSIRRIQNDRRKSNRNTYKQEDLVVSKALKLLSENEDVHEIDRRTAKELHEMGLKGMKEGE